MYKELVSDISLTVIVCYANDCERATVRRVCANSTDLVQEISNSHGLTPNTADGGMHESLVPLRARQVA